MWIPNIFKEMFAKNLKFVFLEFAKSRAIRACVPPTWSTCQRACVPAWLKCQHACAPAWFTCQRACVPTCQKRANISFLRANVPINVPTCNAACQRTRRRANFSTCRTNVSKGVPIFQTFLLRNAQENFYTLL